MKTILILVLCTSLAIAHPGDVSKKEQNPYTRNVGIIGGDYAVEGEFPYQISVGHEAFSLPRNFCGGTLYNEKFVITACHCVLGLDSDNPSDLKVVAGELDLKVESGNEQPRKVIRIINHPDYNTTTFENDVALLEVDVPFEFNEFVKPIAIPDKLQSFTGDCVVSGWGTVVDGAAVFPGTLLKVSVPIVSDEDCYQDYVNYNWKPTPSMICAGEKNKDSCQGDSGGPLACDGFLAGIVSWGRGCAKAGYPGVYTEVSYFADWIVKNAISQTDRV